MSESFAVEPLPGAYVNEWVALCYEGPGDFGSVKRLLNGTSWVAQLDLTTGNAVLSRIHQYGVEQWTLFPGYWAVRSPHDKVRFMDSDEFSANFKVTL